MTLPTPLPMLAAATIALAVLTGCSGPAPVTPAPDPATETSADPDPVSASELDYPYGVSEEFLDGVDDANTAFLAWHETFTTDCSADLAGSADSPECTDGMLTGLQNVNAIKTLFDFSYDNADWDGGEYTGLVALAPTRDAVKAASQSGSDFVDVCFYVPGANDDCPATAQAFLDDADEVASAIEAWRR